MQRRRHVASGDQRAKRPNHPPDRLDVVLPEADFVATPATTETVNLLDRRRLSLIKPGAGLVNVGREPVVDYGALAELLRRAI
jgi:phosphoglycerate dehydrogenase-like enzyme